MPTPIQRHHRREGVVLAIGERPVEAPLSSVKLMVIRSPVAAITGAATTSSQSRFPLPSLTAAAFAQMQHDDHMAATKHHVLERLPSLMDALKQKVAMAELHGGRRAPQMTMS